jgi:hypothetical protein
MVNQIARRPALPKMMTVFSFSPLAKTYQMTGLLLSIG